VLPYFLEIFCCCQLSKLIRVKKIALYKVVPDDVQKKRESIQLQQQIYFTQCILFSIVLFFKKAISVSSQFIPHSLQVYILCLLITSGLQTHSTILTAKRTTTLVVSESETRRPSTKSLREIDPLLAAFPA
jgi:hypothetical protein